MLTISSFVRRRVLAAAALALIALAGPVTAAHAAPYTVSFCGAADRSAPTFTPFFKPYGLFTIDQCQTGGGFGLQFAGHALDSSSPVGVRLILPTDQPVRMTALDFSIEMGGTTSGSAAGALLFFDETSATTVEHVEDWPGGASPAIAPITVHMPAHSLSSRILLQATSLGHTTFSALAGGADMLIRNLTITLDDPFPPADATFDTASPLFSASGARGTSALLGVAHDAESGVGHVEVYDGTTLLARSVDSTCPRIAINACPVDQSFNLGIDTTRLAEGAHRLAVKTFDASGQSTTTLTPPFVVDNVPDPAGTPTPTATPGPTTNPGSTPTPAAKAPTATIVLDKLKGGAARRRHASRFTGKVRSSTPLTASVRVVIQVRSAYGWQDVAIIRTAKSGTYSWSHTFKTSGRFTFRARILGGQGFASQPKPSSSVSVRVR